MTDKTLYGNVYAYSNRSGYYMSDLFETAEKAEACVNNGLCPCVAKAVPVTIPAAPKKHVRWVRKYGGFIAPMFYTDAERHEFDEKMSSANIKKTYVWIPAELDEAKAE